MSNRNFFYQQKKSQVLGKAVVTLTIIAVFRPILMCLEVESKLSITSILRTSAESFMVIASSALNKFIGESSALGKKKKKKCIEKNPHLLRGTTNLLVIFSHQAIHNLYRDISSFGRGIGEVLCSFLLKEHGNCMNKNYKL